MRRPLLLIALAFALTLLVIEPACAVIFKSTGAPDYNTNAPGGALAGSGWQYQGQFNVYLGTPIAPTFFIAAKHIGGGTNMDFRYDQRTYKTVAYFDCPDADLRVFQVDQTFASFAPLYTNSTEVGQHCVVFGRGTERGDSIVSNGVTNGWKWGVSTSVERWGENDIDSVVTDPIFNQLLYCTFDKLGNSNECTLTGGDSSGAMFLQDGGRWKLAGINTAVDGPFSADSTGSKPFDAGFLDARGFYAFDGSTWQLISKPTPSGFYCSRISAHTNWIQSVINYRPANDFRLLSISRSGNDLKIELLTAAGREYRVEYTVSLVQPTWTSVADVIALSNTTIVVDAGAAVQSDQRYYRLLLVR